jgi:hypothetical protein
MKIRRLLAISGIVATLVSASPSAFGVLINITNDLGSPAALVSDYDKGAVGSMGQDNVFNWLSDIVDSYNLDLNSGTDLPDPVGGGSGGFEALVENSGGTIDLTGYKYAVLHYGKGKGGAGQGGGVVAFYLNGTIGDYTFPSNGAGPNGKGGLSFVRLYGGQNGTTPPPNSVPEGGSTIALLGMTLLGVGALRRKFGTQ